MQTTERNVALEALGTDAGPWEIESLPFDERIDLWSKAAVTILGEWRCTMEASFGFMDNCDLDM